MTCWRDGGWAGRQPLLDVMTAPSSGLETRWNARRKQTGCTASGAQIALAAKPAAL